MQLKTAIGKSDTISSSGQRFIPLSLSAYEITTVRKSASCQAASNVRRLGVRRPKSGS